MRETNDNAPRDHGYKVSLVANEVLMVKKFSSAMQRKPNYSNLSVTFKVLPFLCLMP